MLEKYKTTPKRILIVDDEPSIRIVLSAALNQQGYEICTAKDGAEAYLLVEETSLNTSVENFALVISDLKMPKMNGMELLEKLNDDFPDLPVVMLTAHGTVDMAVEALKKGAFDFICKPYEQNELLSIVKKSLMQGQSKKKIVHKNKSESARELLGRSVVMKTLLQRIDMIADSPSTVLISGESGTGKELVATAIHEGSSRDKKAFIRLNCGAIPTTLIEAELFGYEKGAFTGAAQMKLGKFELADQGSLFLDEIADLPLDMQVKLLRVLQDGQFERVGGLETIQVDVRLIAASNLPLKKQVAQGAFRKDLFYRLHVVPLHLPPLRERIEDIDGLLMHFLDKMNKKLNRQVDTIPEETLNILKKYPWPGNIRELENCVERALLFASGTKLEKNILPEEILDFVSNMEPKIKAEQNTALQPVDFLELEEKSMKEIVKEATAGLEKDLIQKALLLNKGNVSQTAKYLQISRKGLQNKMKEFELERECE